MNLKMRLPFYLLMFLGSIVINKRVAAQCKGIGIPESGKIMLENPQSWALESGIQLNESEIPRTIGIQIPSSTDRDWDPVPGIGNPRSGIQNPRLSWIPLHGVRVASKV